MNTNHKAFRIFAILALLTASLILYVPSACADRFITVDFPGAVSTYVTGINNKGQIVGAYDDGVATHGFVWSKGRFWVLDYPKASLTFPESVNDAGQIVGVFDNGEAFEFDGRFLNLGSCVKGFVWRNPARGINNMGEIVGSCSYGYPKTYTFGYTLIGGVYHLFSYEDFYTELWGVNDAGDAVGWYADRAGFSHGLLMSQGTFQVINFPGANATQCSGINGHSQVVGSYSSDGLFWHGFALVGQKFLKIDFPGAISTVPHGIDSNGDVVGYYQDAAGNPHGFVRLRSSN